jgi:hypothetical protein
MIQKEKYVCISNAHLDFSEKTLPKHTHFDRRGGDFRIQFGRQPPGDTQPRCCQVMCPSLVQTRIPNQQNGERRDLFGAKQDVSGIVHTFLTVISNDLAIQLHPVQAGHIQTSGGRGVTCESL